MRMMLTALGLVCGFSSIWGQELLLPPADRIPRLRLDQGHSSRPVLAAAFAPDGTLHLSGLDKQIRRYRRVGNQWQAITPYPLPIGTGNAGAVNALAFSPDGRWLAVAGRSPMRDESSLAEEAVVLESEAISDTMRRDLGIILLLRTDQVGGGRVLRGHRGPVRALSFALGTSAERPILISAAVEPEELGKQPNQPRNGEAPTKGMPGEQGVVRVWDIVAGKEIARRSDFPPTLTLPRLAAWTQGEAGLNVAVAWPNPNPATAGELRVWNVPSGELRTSPDGWFNRPLILRQTAEKRGASTVSAIISGGFRPPEPGKSAGYGRLQIRPLDRLDAGTEVAFPFAEGKHFLPLAIAESAEHLLVLLETAPKPAERTDRPAELQRLNRAGERRQRVPLTGLDPGILPNLVLSGDGATVAITGFRDHRVELYDLADLTAGRVQPMTIPGLSPGWDAIEFLAEDRLWLGRAGESRQQGGWQFDFPRRTLRRNDGQSESASIIDSATVSWILDQKPAGVLVQFPNRVLRLSLRGNEQPTAALVIPEKPRWNPRLGPIVMVAHNDPVNAVIGITVFDAVTGRPLRQLIGPELPIRALACSASRPLLAAVGHDEQITVWSLKSLSREIGAIEGLQLREAAGQLEVVSVEQAADAVKAVLKPGDRVTAVATVGGKAEPVRTIAEFVWAIRSRPIGSRVALTLAGRPPGAPAIVPVGRGLEQDGPLLSLWLSPGKPDVAGNAGGQWVGWSPGGPYDASSPQAEAKIGWISNTGDPASPVRFAPVQQYRRDYFKPEILQKLVETGDLAAAVAAHYDAFPPDTLRVLAQFTPTEPGPGNEPLFRGGPATLRLMIQGLDDAIPQDRAALYWKLIAPGREQHPVQTIPLKKFHGPLTIDLKDEPWRRGRYRIEAWYQRTPDSPPLAAATLEFLMRPPAPELSLQIDDHANIAAEHTTMAETITLAAEVAAVPGLARTVRVDLIGPDGQHRSEALPAVPDSTTRYGPVKLALRPGHSEVRITAENQGAGSGPEAELERTTLTRVIRFTPPKIVPPPQIATLEVSPLLAHRTGAAGEMLCVCNRSAVTVRSVVEATEPLLAVDWDDGTGQWQPLKLDPASPKRLAVQQELRLAAGQPRTVRIRARVSAAPAAIRDSTLVFEPPLPRVTVIPPSSETTSERAIILRGQYDSAAVQAPFVIEAILSTADTEHVFAASTAEKNASWSATIPVQRGINRISLRLRNQWHTETLPEPITILAVRPPRLLTVEPVDAGDQAVAKLTAWVMTEDDPDLTPDRLNIDGRDVAGVSVVKRFQFLGTAFWSLEAEAVPVQSAGTWKETFRIAVGNRDGLSQSRVVPIKRQPKPTRPPRIVVAGGDSDRRTEESEFPLVFKVVSDSALSRIAVEITAATDFSTVVSVDPAELGRAPADGQEFSWSVERRIPLRFGVNRLRITAVNADGEAVCSFAISYTEPALRIVIDGIEERLPDRTIRNLSLNESALGDDQLPMAVTRSGFVTVRGRVVWSGSEPAFAREPGLSAVLSVNYVNHLPVQLELPSGRGRERRFVAPLFLNAADCLVEVVLRHPSRGGTLPLEASGATRFRIRCDSPLIAQRLHLVIVGVDVPAAERFTLAERVIRALGGRVPGKNFESGRFRHPAFQNATLYPPVVGWVVDGDINGILDEVDRELRRLGVEAEHPWLNDVVLLYYQGKDWVAADGRRWLHTSRSLKYPERVAQRFAVGVHRLPDTPGVRLILLNVVEPTAEPAKSLGSVASAMLDPPLLRYVWKDERAAEHLFDYLATAVTRERLLGEVIDRVQQQVLADPDRSQMPDGIIPAELRPRPFGRVENSSPE